MIHVGTENLCLWKTVYTTKATKQVSPADIYIYVIFWAMDNSKLNGFHCSLCSPHFRNVTVAFAISAISVYCGLDEGSHAGGLVPSVAVLRRWHLSQRRPPGRCLGRWRYLSEGMKAGIMEQVSSQECYKARPPHIVGWFSFLPCHAATQPEGLLSETNTWGYLTLDQPPKL